MIDLSKFEESEFVEEIFTFWFNDHDHVRSPFPLYIHPKLKDEACTKFSTWLNHLKEGAEEEVNDMVVVEKFEEIIFETALSKVKTEDERITIKYPFLPRLNDKMANGEDKTQGASYIFDRQIIKKDDHEFLKVRLKRELSDEVWETDFELPV